MLLTINSKILLIIGAAISSTASHAELIRQPDYKSFAESDLIILVKRDNLKVSGADRVTIEGGHLLQGQSTFPLSIDVLRLSNEFNQWIIFLKKDPQGWRVQSPFWSSFGLTGGDRCATLDEALVSAAGGVANAQNLGELAVTLSGAPAAVWDGAWSIVKDYAPKATPDLALSCLVFGLKSEGPKALMRFNPLAIKEVFKVGVDMKNGVVLNDWSGSLRGKIATYVERNFATLPDEEALLLFSFIIGQKGIFRKDMLDAIDEGFKGKKHLVPGLASLLTQPLTEGEVYSLWKAFSYIYTNGDRDGAMRIPTSGTFSKNKADYVRRLSNILSENGVAFDGRIEFYTESWYKIYSRE